MFAVCVVLAVGWFAMSFRGGDPLRSQADLTRASVWTAAAMVIAAI